MPSVMRLLGALGGIDDVELRATFNGGIGMVIVVAAEAVEVAVDALPGAVPIGVLTPLTELGERYVEVGLEGRP
jgi:phosphoribosylaminoimidazole (AIR) synthetase